MTSAEKLMSTKMWNKAFDTADWKSANDAWNTPSQELPSQPKGRDGDEDQRALTNVTNTRRKGEANTEEKEQHAPPRNAK